MPSTCSNWALEIYHQTKHTNPNPLIGDPNVYPKILDTPFRDPQAPKWYYFCETSNPEASLQKAWPKIQNIGHLKSIQYGVATDLVQRRNLTPAFFFTFDVYALHTSVGYITLVDLRRPEDM